MSITELFKHVGDENIVLQNLLHSSPMMHVGKKDGTIKFCTDKQKAQDLCTQAATGSKGQWTGLIVWLPTDKLP